MRAAALERDNDILAKEAIERAVKYEEAARLAAAAQRAAHKLMFAKPKHGSKPRIHKRKVEPPDWADWIEVVDEHGELFYKNTKLNITAWYRPGEEIESVTDEDGHKYYVDRMTAKTCAFTPRSTYCFDATLPPTVL